MLDILEETHKKLPFLGMVQVLQAWFCIWCHHELLVKLSAARKTKTRLMFISGLFQKAIVASGSAVSPWYLNNNPVTASNEIIRILGCNLYQRNSLQCLRAKPADSILRAYDEFVEV